MDGLHDNPFAALTLIAAPAVLTNAASLLALSTSNRFAHVVERQRYLSLILEQKGAEMDTETGALRLRQLRRAERRAELVLRALTSFYVSLGAFAAASLISLIGAAGAEAYGVLAMMIRLAALSVGLVGVSGLVLGCTVLVRETRLTLYGLREEANFSQNRFEALRPPVDRSPIPK